jgi:GT2 family glycosyltransferase
MLETLCSWLDRHREAGAAYCRVSGIDEDGNPLTSTPWSPRLRPSRLGIEAIPDDDAITPFVSIFSLAGIVPSTMVMRRSVYEQTPGWDEAFGQHYEDTLLFLHLALRGQIHFVAKALVRHRRHQGQSTSQPEKFQRQERKLYDAWRGRTDLSPSEAEVVRKAWQFRERRVIPADAWAAAKRQLRAGRVLHAARFLGGAARVFVGSVVLGAGRSRS